MEARLRDRDQVLQDGLMRTAKFKVGDLVTRGRGRDTLLVKKVRVSLADDGKTPIYRYDLVNSADERTNPRRIWGAAESNLRPAKEAKT